MNKHEDSCPHCEANLQGEPIPVESQDLYGRTHFNRVIGIEVPEVYDGILFWQCPDCGGRWHRWHKGTRLHDSAAPYVDVQ